VLSLAIVAAYRMSGESGSLSIQPCDEAGQAAESGRSPSCAVTGSHQLSASTWTVDVLVAGGDRVVIIDRYPMARPPHESWMPVMN